jgi:hypothetical protein
LADFRPDVSPETCQGRLSVRGWGSFDGAAAWSGKGNGAKRSAVVTAKAHQWRFNSGERGVCTD